MDARHFTSVEQSKRLLELGLSPKSADMTYRWRPFNEFLSEPPVVGNIRVDLDTPCWSLGALLEVLPKEIATDDFHGNKTAFLILGGYGSRPCVSYRVRTKDTERYPDGESPFHVCAESSWMGTLYSMVVWLLENNHIKK